jgi:hypothetical protein
VINHLNLNCLGIVLPTQTVHYGHVAHWLWRLLLDDVGAFREDILGLPALPYEAIELDAAGSGSQPLPRAPLLLYGISPRVLMGCPAALAVWDLPRVVFTGFALDTRAISAELTGDLGAFVARQRGEQRSIAYAGFGSMARLGVLADPRRLFTMAAQGVASGQRVRMPSLADA